MSLAILPLAITMNANSWLVNIIVYVIFILLILS
jgi:hypothetical protein